MFGTRRPSESRPALSLLALASTALALGSISAPARAEPAACLSPDPAQWPAPSKPYFMLVVDTSGSMILSVPGAAPSCAGYASTRMGHARCAVKNTVLAFGGEVNFGLAQYASFMNGCGASCYGNDSNNPLPGCDIQCYGAELAQNNNICAACGPMDNKNDPTTRRGGRVLVPMQVDNTWGGGPTPSNLPTILQYVDNNCTNNLEVTSVPTDGPQYGKTPLNGVLRDMRRYFATGWTAPDNSVSYATPLDANDRACRSVNVILLTDGDETCDTQQDAVNAAAALYQTGVTVGGKTYKIPVHVINFAGGSQANTDAIASAGGTGASYFATNEVQLSQALANIVSKAIKPETCDNTDNNCNGCTDEGFVHYCDVQPVAANCCAWANAAARATCLANYTASITAQNPQGDKTKLPCTTALQQQDPTLWLCYDPGEKCDNVDNNCQAGVDDGVTKCGSPLACPKAETCNGQDDDCDGLIDNGNVCQSCIPSPEVCDGCDNDCDGIADNGIAPIACGQPSPPNCAGQLTCKAPQAVPQKGACVVGGGFNACNNAPAAETCDGLDNNCNGLVDDGIAPVACIGAGQPNNLVYGGTSQCKKGTQTCGGSCQGFVGPSAEICDGIDNDCDGQVDEQAFGAGQACGNSTPPCVAGTTACVNGALVCQGGTGPQPEICDGKDNNCDGVVDNALSDAPAAAQSGCWTLPGNCCAFKNLSWCPPAGGTCYDNGSLTAPCTKGTLTCAGLAGWTCSNAKGPASETCNNVDDNCDGAIDNVAPVACVPQGQPGNLVYGGTSQCQKGTQTCAGACQGFVGPSTEICDGIDNDCDGQVDEGIGGLGQPCGVNQPPCSAGATACVNGAIVCQGGKGPQAEICDGIDNDCDGKVDDAPLADAPAPGQNGCWNLPPNGCGQPCSFGSLSWCAPPGATCFGNGTLAPPCNKGAIACAGANGWICQGPKAPAAETCDGVDNDCNGKVDSAVPQIGTACGTDTGECVSGVLACAAGVLDCVGDVPPIPEACNGLDDDCDGQVDNGIPTGGPCMPQYDTNIYPGPRDKGACQPGVLACDGKGGTTCVGGIGPSPELCDGIDNDCDGQVDEAGPAPDGIDKSPNPLPPPNASLGDACGTNQGECAQGKWACVNGLFTCVGGAAAAPEECDCLDNDCDGKVDEPNPNDAPPLCSPGKTCVHGSGGCQCAQPCGGEFGCPAGQKQETVKDADGKDIGCYCVIDPCGDCTFQTLKDKNGNVICAPPGTLLPGCVTPPVCTCKGAAGCGDPCAGVMCPAGQTCAGSGPNAGTCVVDNCFNVPCQGCDKACNAGTCVDAPCKADTCPPDQVCKPTADFKNHVCVPSCAGATCAADQVCVDGQCKPGCSPACEAGKVCDLSASPPTCVQSKCAEATCGDGACCDPLTGACGTCPCENVICPAGQACQNGQCGEPMVGTSGASGGTGGGSATGASSSSGAGGAGGAQEKGVWGLASGGGGCSCDLGARSSDGRAAWALAALALLIARRRRRSTNERGARAGEEVSR